MAFARAVVNEGSAAGSAESVSTVAGRRRERAEGTLTGTIIQAAAQYAEARPWWAAAALFPIFIWLVLPTSLERRLWHDELFTYYLARTSSWSRMLEISTKVDLNPPLSYVLTRLGIAFGAVEPISYRLPELLAFTVASLFLFQFVKRRVASTFAAASILLLWWNPFIYYATEARPYGLLVAFTAILLSAWDSAIGTGNRRSLSLVMTSLAAFGVLLTHVFGVLSYGAFILAESVRTVQRGKIDWRVWAALLIPSVALLTYVPLFRLHAVVLYPEALSASMSRAILSYEIVLANVVRPISLICLCAVAVPRFFRDKGRVEQVHPIDLPIAVVLSSLFIIPLIENIALHHSGAGFFDRYGICVIIPVSVVPLLLAALATRNNRYVGSAAALCLILGHILVPLGVPQAVVASVSGVDRKLGKKANFLVSATPALPAPWLRIPKPLAIRACDSAPFLTSIGQFPPIEPIVMSSALTFLETDHVAGDELGYRLFFLTDRAAAARIAHATLFESYGEMKQYFPIQGAIEPYRQFRQKYSTFLVVGTYGYPEEWIIRELQAENVPMRVIGRFGPYQECVLQVGESAMWSRGGTAEATGARFGAASSNGTTMSFRRSE